MLLKIRICLLIALVLVVQTIAEPAGVVLSLVPFQESSHALRLVPNTKELNGFANRIIAFMKQSSINYNGDQLSVSGVHKQYEHWMNNQSVSGTFQTSNASVQNFTDLSIIGNTYIYSNEEDRVQIVTKLAMSPIVVYYEQYFLEIGTMKVTGDINVNTDVESVDVSFTVYVKRNSSLPLVLVCDGHIDKISLNIQGFRSSIKNLGGTHELYSEAYDWLSDHFKSTILPQLQALLSSYVEAAVRMDEEVCSTLVLCKFCSFYAADF